MRLELVAGPGADLNFLVCPQGDECCADEKEDEEEEEKDETQQVRPTLHSMSESAVPKAPTHRSD